MELDRRLHNADIAEHNKVSLPIRMLYDSNMEVKEYQLYSRLHKPFCKHSVNYLLENWINDDAQVSF